MQAKEGDLVHHRQSEINKGYGVVLSIIKDDQDAELKPTLDGGGVGYISDDDYPLVKIVWSENAREQVLRIADVEVIAQARQPSD